MLIAVIRYIFSKLQRCITFLLIYLQSRPNWRPRFIISLLILLNLFFLIHLYTFIRPIFLLFSIDYRYGRSGNTGYILFFGPLFISLKDIGVIVHSSISLLLQISHLPLDLLLATHRSQSCTRFRLIQTFAKRTVGVLIGLYWPCDVALRKFQWMLVLT
jgi:hypothetical protein